MNNGVKKNLIVFLPVILVSLFNLLIFNRYFPLSEGWWETYGYFINNGLKLHKDLDFALSPIFIYLSAFLLKITGNSYFYIRLIGVFSFSLTTLILQQFLRNFFSLFASSIAAIFASFLFISSPQFIAKDYHTYVHLITLAWLFLLVKSVGSTKGNIAVIQDIVLGVLLVVIFFLKQNVGILLLFSLMVHFLIFRPIRVGAPHLVGILTGFVLAFFVFQYFPGFDLSLLQGNDAKGTISTVLFRFVTEYSNRKPLLIAVILGFFSIYYWDWLFRVWVIINNQLLKIFPRPTNVWLSPELKLFLVSAIILASGRLREFWIQSIIPIALSVLLVHLLRYIFGNKLSALSEPQRIVILPLCALAYANTNTAAFDFNGMFEVIAYATAAILSIAGMASINLKKLLSMLLMLTVFYIAIIKMIRPYEWWGNNQGNIISANKEVAYPELNNIYMDEPTQRAFDVTKNAIEHYSKSDNDVYMFNLPIFYQLEHKKIFGRLPVQWFDVVTDKQIEEDYQNVKRRRPSVIVMFEPDNMAFTAHMELKHVRELTQEKMIRKVEQWTAQSEYVFVKSVALFPRDDADTYNKYSLENTKSNILLLNPIVNGKTIEEIFSLMGIINNHVVVTDIIRNQDGFEMRINPDIANLKLRLGDYLVIRGPRENIVGISEKLGLAKGEGRVWNTITIYVRKDRYDEKNSAIAATK